VEISQEEAAVVAEESVGELAISSPLSHNLKMDSVIEVVAVEAEASCPDPREVKRRIRTEKTNSDKNSSNLSRMLRLTPLRPSHTLLISTHSRDA